MASKRKSGSKTSHGTIKENEKELKTFEVTYQNHKKRMVNAKSIKSAAQIATHFNKPYSIVIKIKET